MNPYLEQLQDSTSRLEKKLRKLKTKQLGSSKQKGMLRTFVSNYFEQIQPHLCKVFGTGTHMQEVDESMHGVLRFAQKNTLITKCLQGIKRLAKVINALEIESVQLHSQPQNITGDSLDSKIIDTLSKYVPSAAASYEQAILDLQNIKRKSWRGIVAEFRESLRELVDTMAPDGDVEAQPGYKPETSMPSQTARPPTTKQKVTFILKNRKLSDTQIKTCIESINTIEAKVGQFIRSIQERSNRATHGIASREEATRIKDYIALAFKELLEISD